MLRPLLVPVLGLRVGADALGVGGGLPAAAERSGAVWEPRSGPQQRSAAGGDSPGLLLRRSWRRPLATMMTSAGAALYLYGEPMSSA